MLAWIPLGGCSTPAYRDVYRQQMASEIRNLEDQLYAADEANRRLADKLESCRRGCSVDSPPPKSQLPSPILSDGLTIEMGDSAVPPDVPLIDSTIETRDIPSPGPRSSIPGTVVPIPTPDSNVHDLGSGLETDWDMMELDVQMGEVVDPNELTVEPDNISGDADPARTGEPTDPSTELIRPPPREASPAETSVPTASTEDAATKTRDRSTDPFQDSDENTPLMDPPSTDDRPTTLPPPIGLPEPPGPEDLRGDPIERGPIAPPLRPLDPAEPPGRIGLPPVQSRATPTQIFVHPTYSGLDIGEDGMAKKFDLVLCAADADQRVMDLANFDLDATLKILIRDPQADFAQSSLGLWQFDPEQTASMVDDLPLPGIHVPIRWGGRSPSGDRVSVAVELRSGDEVMRCQAELDLRRDARVAGNWLPRGGQTTDEATVPIKLDDAPKP